MIEIHCIEEKHHKNTKKQAEQIKFFLSQAKEYFDASRVVTLVTRPVLLYYSAMCLATAEVLFKQSGESSLDRARENHRHHGLVFINDRAKPLGGPFTCVASSMRSKPAIRTTPGAIESQGRFGTFELWHRTAREAPMVADITSRINQESVSFYGSVAYGSDMRLPLLPEEGITLLEAMQNIPSMSRLLQQLGSSSKLIRSHVKRFINASTLTESITIHPGDKNLVEEFWNNIKVNPNDGDLIKLTEYTSGGLIVATIDLNVGLLRVIYPPCCCEEYPNVMFWTKNQPLNEFGYIYTALHMAGNYARYYPDHWIHDVEHHTDLGLAIEGLVDAAEKRLPLLTLSELSQTYLVPSS